MKRVEVAVINLFVLLTLILFPSASAAGLEAHTAEDDHTPLARHMEEINSNFRQLRALIQDPAAKSESLAAVETIAEHFKEARKLEPAKLADIPEAEKEKFLEGYRAGIDHALSVVDELREAIESDADLDRLRELVVRLNDTKNENHEKFRKE